MAGEQAVKKAVEGFTDYCIGFERATDEAGNYKCLPKMIPLSDIANTEKKLPREWINAEGNFITEDYVKYALPLIQGESHPPVEDGLPRFAHLAKIK
jgi:6-phosphofructokinase 1